MTTEKDLQKVVRERLGAEGYLNKLQGEVRTRVLESLRGAGRAQPPPPRPQILGIINGLIAEYLQWMAYTYTNTIFMEESGTEDVNRRRLTEYLDAREDDSTRPLPLLVSILTDYRQRRQH